MSSNDGGETRPRVLFVYYTHTKQAQRVCDAMADGAAHPGLRRDPGRIEFTDPRSRRTSRRFRSSMRSSASSRSPAAAAPQDGQIGIPDEAKGGDYDLVCFGSPRGSSRRACRCART